MDQATARVRVAESLRFLLSPGSRDSDLAVPVDGVSSLVHIVESLGVPRTEIGEVRVAGRPSPVQSRPRPGDLIEVLPVRRPQRLADPRFVLDVHLGALARRMRLLGIDSAYRNDATDPQLVAQANTQRRVLLTQDRGLLRRRALTAGAYVRGSRPDEQLVDVLDRFWPPLVPWTRCPACNTILEPVPKREIAHLLQPGTRRSYEEFSRCPGCGRVYWRGAHAERINGIVAQARGEHRDAPPNQP
jgi:uncharacterized protein with PIN domain